MKYVDRVIIGKRSTSVIVDFRRSEAVVGLSEPWKVDVTGVGRGAAVQHLLYYA